MSTARKIETAVFAQPGDPAALATPGATSVLPREWRRASWPVRISATCLLLFYALAIASPFFAPYDPTTQYRTLPNCPPMPLHINAPSDWAHGFFYSHPMRIVDAVERAYTADTSRKLYVRVLHRGHLFTTDGLETPYFALGSDGLGRDLLSRIVYGSRISMSIGLVGVIL